MTAGQRAEIDATRVRLSAHASRLADRASPRQLVRHRTSRARDTGSGTRRRIMGPAGLRKPVRACASGARSPAGSLQADRRAGDRHRRRRRPAGGRSGQAGAPGPSRQCCGHSGQDASSGRKPRKSGPKDVGRVWPPLGHDHQGMATAH
ncbi:DUF3618 domain-containing protein [Streptomyces cinerochromogenes]|uniref:DUF3618 domain-containing protein n=1 Tax=Streptomyces cinerochromogenes TaxID=66422 RepID=UPI0016705E4B